MSTKSNPFIIEEHILEGQHVREYPRAAREGECLQLSVKRYIPKSNQDPKPGDLTIIGAHGSGYPKELYEPLWENICTRLSSHGIRVCSIWIADTANQGASGILNEKKLGNDPSWFDHSRDLLYMINQFQAAMPGPIMGIGHSMGAGQLALLSLMHPRLFTSLVLIEPVMVPDIYTGMGPEFVTIALAKKSSWPSRHEAERYLRKSYRKWDPRVLELYLEYGLRSQQPTVPDKESNPSDSKSSPVSLITHPRQEALQYLRPNFQHKQPASGDASHPDIIGPARTTSLFYRTEPILLWNMLPHIRPSVLFVFGGKSPISTAPRRGDLLERTGTGVGGSGGVKQGKVKEVTVLRAGHTVPLEEVDLVSESVVEWVRGEMGRWNDEQERVKREWEGIDAGGGQDQFQDWEGPLKEATRLGQEARKMKL
ncbi:alpha/beta-hydrolase [Aspergillus unguis]